MNVSFTKLAPAISGRCKWMSALQSHQLSSLVGVNECQLYKVISCPLWLCKWMSASKCYHQPSQVSVNEYKVMHCSLRYKWMPASHYKVTSWLLCEWIAECQLREVINRCLRLVWLIVISFRKSWTGYCEWLLDSQSLRSRSKWVHCGNRK